MRRGAFLVAALAGLSIISVVGQTAEQMRQEHAIIDKFYTHSRHHGHLPAKVPREAYTDFGLTKAPTLTPTASPTFPSRRVRFHAALPDGWAPCLHLGCRHTEVKECPHHPEDCGQWRIVIFHHGEETSNMHNCGLEPASPGQLLSERSCSCYCKIDNLIPGTLIPVGNSQQGGDTGLSPVEGSQQDGNTRLIPVDSSHPGGKNMMPIDQDGRTWPSLISAKGGEGLNDEALALGEGEVEHTMVSGQGASTDTEQDVAQYVPEAGHFPHHKPAQLQATQNPRQQKSREEQTVAELFGSKPEAGHFPHHKPAQQAAQNLRQQKSREEQTVAELFGSSPASHVN
jgi:hypothetical protein